MLSAQTKAQQILFPKKGKKAKKSINAVLLASGVVASIGYSSFFNVLTGGRVGTKSDSALLEQSELKSISRRTQSLSTLPYMGGVLSSKENQTPISNKNSLNTQIASTNSKNQLPADDDDILWDLEDEFAKPDQQHPPPTLIRAPTTRNSVIHFSPRRIQSAPMMQLKKLEPQQEDLLFEDEDEFLVASVKEKACKRRDLNLQLKQIGGERNFESWDDDFDVDMDEFIVPPAVENIQKIVKEDISNMRRFALHIEDIKHIYMDTKDISSGIKPSTLKPLIEKYSESIKYVETLIELAEHTEEEYTHQPHNSRNFDLQTLSEILKIGVREQEKTNQAFERGMTIQELEDMISDGRVHFGVDLVPALIKGIIPLKQTMDCYLKELRCTVAGGIKKRA